MQCSFPPPIHLPLTPCCTTRALLNLWAINRTMTHRIYILLLCSGGIHFFRQCLHVSPYCSYISFIKEQINGISHRIQWIWSAYPILWSSWDETPCYETPACMQGGRDKGMNVKVFLLIKQIKHRVWMRGSCVLCTPGFLRVDIVFCLHVYFDCRQLTPCWQMITAFIHIKMWVRVCVFFYVPFSFMPLPGGTFDSEKASVLSIEFV